MPPKSYKWNYVIVGEKCMNCATCVLECRDAAIEVFDNLHYAIDLNKCIRCARCFNACPVAAVERQPVTAAS
ncbi:MAG: 4Fe-4S dicluster domain-containing protein [Bacillota bacterium]